MQDELINIFKKLKSILGKYERPLKPKWDLDSKYDLWSTKDVEVYGRKRKEIYFAGLIIQSNYVGFYFMPVYSNPELKKAFGSELLELLNGKSCFHVKHLDNILEQQIGKALKIGYNLYKKRGWI
jgi:hypothetical protein